MITLDPYNIPFKGLSDGLHEFRFRLDKDFFSRFPEGEIRLASITVNLILERKTTFLVLDFSLSGTAEVQCDRCLDYFDIPIQHRARVYVKFGHQEAEEKDDVIFLEPEEHQVHVAQLLYEFAHLGLPYQRIHPENKQGKSLCNQEMLAKLAKFSAGRQEETPSDPRWDELKKIRNIKN